jgi:peptide-methionine (S)-S-oxide reductase
MVNKATFGGGCFWCIEAVMKDIDGVKSVVSGYAGGDSDNPSYSKVCSGNTGHAEVVQVEYDETELSYRDLIKVFFAVHNPETINREGPDIGSQYRSIVLYHDNEQKEIVNEIIQNFEDNNIYDNIVTELKSFDNFYKAEQKHQDFFNKNPNHPYCQAHIPQKLKKLEKRFPSLSGD